MEDTAHIKTNRRKADVRIKEATLRARFTYDFPVLTRFANENKRVHKRYQLIK